MSEWIDPRYEELVAAWRRAQQPESRDPREPQPRRAFIVPPRG
ncbi:hypothetical protein [Streptomyces bangladeshensis]|uniref:Uncharacterized protein n=1 Tax=Streptomyces bangladeshensis TaxID=295352 RepID=A0ABN3BT90_9ACTN